MLHFFKNPPNLNIAALLQTDINLCIHNQADSDNLMPQLKNSGFNKILTTTVTHFSQDQRDDQKLTGTGIHTIRLYGLEEALEKLISGHDLESFGKDYILLKAPLNILITQLEEVVFRLELKGYTPVLAHAERYLDLQKNYQKVLKLYTRGCLLEVDLISLTGHHGFATQRLAERLLKESLVSFVGSGVGSMDEHEKFNSLLYSKKLSKHLQSAKIKNKELA